VTNFVLSSTDSVRYKANRAARRVVQRSRSLARKGLGQLLGPFRKR
jgi:hypothetical protein